MNPTGDTHTHVVTYSALCHSHSACQANDAGTFWMTFHDFLRRFAVVEVCKARLPSHGWVTASAASHTSPGRLLAGAFTLTVTRPTWLFLTVLQQNKRGKFGADQTQSSRFWYSECMVLVCANGNGDGAGGSASPVHVLAAESCGPRRDSPPLELQLDAGVHTVYVCHPSLACQGTWVGGAAAAVPASAASANLTSSPLYLRAYASAAVQVEPLTAAPSTAAPAGSLTSPALQAAACRAWQSALGRGVGVDVYARTRAVSVEVAAPRPSSSAVAVAAAAASSTAAARANVVDLTRDDPDPPVPCVARNRIGPSVSVCVVGRHGLYFVVAASSGPSPNLPPDNDTTPDVLEVELESVDCYVKSPFLVVSRVVEASTAAAAADAEVAALLASAAGAQQPAWQRASHTHTTLRLPWRPAEATDASVHVAQVVAVVLRGSLYQSGSAMAPADAGHGQGHGERGSQRLLVCARLLCAPPASPCTGAVVGAGIRGDAAVHLSAPVAAPASATRDLFQRFCDAVSI